MTVVATYVARAGLWVGLAGGGAITPPVSGYPDASTTGVPSGRTLTTMGSTNITSGTNWAYDSRYGFIRINGPVTFTDMYIDADIYNPLWYAITATRCRMPGNLAYTKILQIGDGSVITDCEIGGQVGGSTYAAENGIDMPDDPATQIQVLRCNIHHVVHGLHMNGNAILKDSFIHDMCQGQPGFTDPVAHCNPIFSGNGSNMIVQRNRFYRCGNTSGGGFWQANQAGTQIGPLTYTGNYVGGVDSLGCSVGMAIDDHVGDTNNGPFIVTNNVFEPGWDVAPIFGVTLAGSTITGNTLLDGTPIGNGGTYA